MTKATKSPKYLHKDHSFGKDPHKSVSHSMTGSQFSFKKNSQADRLDEQ